MATHITTKEGRFSMKRMLMLSLGALLVINTIALAGPCDQDKNERPRRTTMSSSGYLGVEIEEVTGDVTGRLRLREERGAWVTSVTDDTAAAKAGLQKDDVITRWNGDTIESARELSRHIRETPAGRSVKLGVLRNGSEMEVAVTLGDRGDYRSRVRVAPIAPVAPVASVAPVTPMAPRARFVVRPATIARVRERDGYQLGISLQSMSPQLAEYFGLQNRNGALVTFVHPDSAAGKAGIKAGDVILSVGGEAVENPRRVVEALRGKGEGPVEVKLMRDRQERAVTVQLEKGKSSLNWSVDEDADIIMSEALVEPFEIGPINIKPLRLAPMALPQIHIAPMPPVALPEMHIAPMVIPRIHIAPMALPRMTVPRINIPKIIIPRMRIVMPDMIFRMQV
jgi:serine protease Do